jgi:hypothetical protein
VCSKKRVIHTEKTNGGIGASTRNVRNYYDTLLIKICVNLFNSFLRIIIKKYVTLFYF